MSEEANVDVHAAGISLAAYLVSINTLIILRKLNQISDADMLEILNRARTVLSGANVPGGPAVLEMAMQTLDLGESLFHAATAQKSPSGAN